MFSYFKYQLKMCFRSMGFITAFSFNLIICLLNTLLIAYQCRDCDVNMLPAASECFILRTNTPCNNIFRLVFIFILVLPFGFYVYKNKKNNIQPILVARTTLKNHYISSAFCSFLCTFICFAIPLLLSAFINYIVFPNDGTLLSEISEYTYNHTAAITGDNVFQNTVQKGEPFVWLYIKSPLVYNIFYSVIFSAFCGLLSLFIHSLSYYIYALPILTFLPLYLITFIQQKIDNVNLSNDTSELYVNYNINDYIMIGTFYGKSTTYFIAFIAISFLLSIILLILNYNYVVGGKNIKGRR